MTEIHPSAIVEKGAELGDSVIIGPFSYIGPRVVVGDGTRIDTCVRIEGKVTIGKNNRILHSAVIGTPPQDVHYKSEETGVIIGSNNIIREFVTIHRATGEGKFTVIGDNNFLMAYVHIAHNCKIGSNVIISNASQLGGYVEVEDHAFLSALIPIHQYCRIGEYSMIGGLSRVNQDIPPYMLAAGVPVAVYGLNIVGLRRKGFKSETIDLLKEAFHLLYTRGLKLEDALARIESLGNHREIFHLIDFIKNSKRGIVRRWGGALRNDSHK